MASGLKGYLLASGVEFRGDSVALTDRTIDLVVAYTALAAGDFDVDKVEVNDGKIKWSGDVDSYSGDKLTLKITAAWVGKKWEPLDDHKPNFHSHAKVGVWDGKVEWDGEVESWDHTKSKLVVVVSKDK